MATATIATGRYSVTWLSWLPLLLALNLSWLMRATPVCAETTAQSVFQHSTGNRTKNLLEILSRRKEGCHYGGRIYRAGGSVSSPDPCLNCTCHASTLTVSCELRVCHQYPVPPPAGCYLVTRQNQCCSQLICADRESRRNVRRRDDEAFSEIADEVFTASQYSNGSCVVQGTVYADGSAMLTSSSCEHCFCIRGRQRCIQPRCSLTEQGCYPQYRSRDGCCPTNYVCRNVTDSSTSATTSISTSTSTTTVSPSAECTHDGLTYPEGSRIETKNNDPCQSCFCLRGSVRCAPILCSESLEGCQPIFAPHTCCPVSYNCSTYIENSREAANKGGPFYQHELSKSTSEQERLSSDRPYVQLARSAQYSPEQRQTYPLSIADQEGRQSTVTRSAQQSLKNTPSSSKADTSFYSRIGGLIGRLWGRRPLSKQQPSTAITGVQGSGKITPVRIQSPPSVRSASILPVNRNKNVRQPTTFYVRVSSGGLRVGTASKNRRVSPEHSAIIQKQQSLLNIAPKNAGQEIKRIGQFEVPSTNIATKSSLEDIVFNSLPLVSSLTAAELPYIQDKGTLDEAPSLENDGDVAEGEEINEPPVTTIKPFDSFNRLQQIAAQRYSSLISKSLDISEGSGEMLEPINEQSLSQWFDGFKKRVPIIMEEDESLEITRSDVFDHAEGSGDDVALLEDDSGTQVEMSDKQVDQDQTDGNMVGLAQEMQPEDTLALLDDQHSNLPLTSQKTAIQADPSKFTSDDSAAHPHMNVDETSENLQPITAINRQSDEGSDQLVELNGSEDGKVETEQLHVENDENEHEADQLIEEEQEKNDGFRDVAGIEKSKIRQEYSPGDEQITTTSRASTGITENNSEKADETAEHREITNISDLQAGENVDDEPAAKTPIESKSETADLQMEHRTSEIDDAKVNLFGGVLSADDQIKAKNESQPSTATAILPQLFSAILASLGSRRTRPPPRPSIIGSTMKKPDSQITPLATTTATAFIETNEEITRTTTEEFISDDDTSVGTTTEKSSPTTPKTRLALDVLLNEEFSKEELPPALPNLRIIPFVAADAVVNRYSDEISKEKLKNRHQLVNFELTQRKNNTELCIVNGTLYNNGELVTNSDAPCSICRCYFGRTLCQPVRCVEIPSNCRESSPSGKSCCPKVVCDGTVGENQTVSAETDTDSEQISSTTVTPTGFTQKQGIFDRQPLGSPVAQAGVFLKDTVGFSGGGRITNFHRPSTKIIPPTNKPTAVREQTAFHQRIGRPVLATRNRVPLNNIRQRKPGVVLDNLASRRGSVESPPLPQNLPPPFGDFQLKRRPIMPPSVIASAQDIIPPWRRPIGYSEQRVSLTSNQKPSVVTQKSQETTLSPDISTSVPVSTTSASVATEETQMSTMSTTEFDIVSSTTKITAETTTTRVVDEFVNFINEHDSTHTRSQDIPEQESPVHITNNFAGLKPFDHLRKVLSKTEQRESNTQKLDSNYSSQEKLLKKILEPRERTSTTPKSVKISTALKDDSSLKNPFKAVSNSIAEGPNPILGMLRLSGCNIFGRMYRTNTVIRELTSECSICRCTSFGVNCERRC